MMVERLQQSDGSIEGGDDLEELSTAGIPTIIDETIGLEKRTVVELDPKDYPKCSLIVKSASTIFCDFDNTLAASKYTITDEMSHEITTILKAQKIVIVTGGTFETIEKNLLQCLPSDTNFSNLDILPLVGNETWTFQDESYEKTSEIQGAVMTDEECSLIREAIEGALDEFGRPEVDFEVKDIVENRGVGTTKFIAMSYFGQDVPKQQADIKCRWDQDRSKRNEIIQLIESKLPRHILENLSIKTGGSTSIDITKRGFDKASGIDHYLWPEMERGDMIFLGDSFQDGGNDRPALKTGVPCLDIGNESQTLELFQHVNT